MTPPTTDSDRVTIVPIERGEVAVRVDAAAGRVHLVHRRRFFGQPVEEPNAVRRLLIVAAAVVAFAGVASIALPVPLAMLTILFPGAFASIFLWRMVDRYSFRELVIAPDGVTVHGEGPLSLARVRVHLHARGWELYDGEQRVDIGDAWGPAGAAWLDRTLIAARNGQFDAIGPDEPLRAGLVRMPRVEPLRVDFKFDHGGLVGEPKGLEGPADPVRLAVIVGLAIACVATIYLIIGMDAISVAVPFMVFMVYDAGLKAVTRTRQWRNVPSQIAVDARAVTVTQRGTRERIALSDITAAFRGHRGIVVLRRDASPRILGSGWNAEALETLHRYLFRAWKTSSAEPESAADVPEALRRLQEQTQTQ